MSAVLAELHAVESLRGYLARTLPAKCAAINATRYAVLHATTPGPYTIPASATIRIGTSPGSEEAVALTSGVRTTAQLVTEIETADVPGVTATADSLDRLTLTAENAPAVDLPSEVTVASENPVSGVNRVFGWGEGEERVVRWPLLAPAGRLGIRDGEHVSQMPRFENGSIGIVFGDKLTEYQPNIRNDKRDVRMNVVVFAPLTSERSGWSELVQQAARAVREVILEDRSLGATVYLAHINQQLIAGTTSKLRDEGGQELEFATAELRLTVTVWERP